MERPGEVKTAATPKAEDRQVVDAQQAEGLCGEDLLQVKACQERRLAW